MLQRVTVTLKRGGDKGLGFSIAGGRGSTPYKDGDPVSNDDTDDGDDNIPPPLPLDGLCDYPGLQ